MDYAEYMRFFFALMFVIGLIGGAALLARRFGLAPGAPTGGRASKKRLEVVEAISLDPKRRLMIIRRDDKEHLVILGADKETVVETGFDAPAENIAAEPSPAPAQVATDETALAVDGAAEKPSEDDDVFARLRKVAELMNEQRAQSLRTGRIKSEQPARRKSANRKIAGGRA